MTSASVGLGVVGLGFMGRRYARFIAGIEGMHLAGVCDISEGLAKEVADEHGCAVYGDPGALAAAAEVAGVIVCTPEDRHREPSLAVLRAGKPLAVEKPIAHTLEAAREIAATGERAGLPVLVGHLLRFEPRWVAARQRLDAGAIGEVVSIATRRVGNVLDQDVLKGRTSIPLYYGVHDLDVMRWFAGSEAIRIYADKHSGALQAAGYDIDDVYCAVLTFGNGVLGAAELGWHVPGNAVAARTSGVTITGTKGFIRIEQGETGFESWTAAGLDRALDVVFWQETYGIPGGALGLEIRHFADVVRGRAQPAIAVSEAVEALRLSLAMEESTARGAAIDLTTWVRQEQHDTL
ncbi:MAG TPA: Gfo/Idh/MocA family oxidoreductase [Thermomicrobiales bacterium]